MRPPIILDAARRLQGASGAELGRNAQPNFGFSSPGGVSAGGRSYTLGKGLPLIASIVKMSGESLSADGLHLC